MADDPVDLFYSAHQRAPRPLSEVIAACATQQAEVARLSEIEATAHRALRDMQAQLDDAQVKFRHLQAEFVAALHVFNLAKAAAAAPDPAL